jgi:hypothetical protein
MVRPIPINMAGLWPEARPFNESAVWSWGIQGRDQATPSSLIESVRSVADWPPLLVVSGLTGGLIMISTLELWPELAALNLGLDNYGAFYLLVSGVYLVATSLYAAWRTRLLRNVRQAAWDTRVMAYANLAVGLAVLLVLLLAFLVLVALVMIPVYLGALLLSGLGGPPKK